MKCENLYHEFKKFEGQPVKIYTEDGKAYTGIDVNAFEDAVRIIDKCDRTILIEYRHITAVVEPMMKLERCCRYDRCEEDGNGYDNGYRNGNGNGDGNRDGNRDRDYCDD